jgi:Zn-dependent M32 family carboxypeptidase
MKNAKSTSRRSARPKAMESKEAREMRESIEEMEGELAELDRDIEEARKSDKGEMSAVALENFLQMRRDMVEMIESNKDLYKTLLESEELARRLERKYA